MSHSLKETPVPTWEIKLIADLGFYFPLFSNAQVHTYSLALVCPSCDIVF